ncbi:MAG: (4Fe-4S)-binding protein [Candidatus Aminicenantes bacterium 4484_214]|nr:MAG: (4Fe-4S)-binding protein [Candidatus Aminicenantes bacterium 4484_214]
MKQLTVISGKGGTGKTTITGTLAVLAQNKIIVDADVDAANLFLLLNPQIKESHKFFGGHKAVIDYSLCSGCGECIPICRFQAIHQDSSNQVFIDSLSCEGCHICSYVCPPKAIKMEENLSGNWFISETEYGLFVHARLEPGEENSGKLVTEIRKKATQLADKLSAGLIIIDGPPGIGCPVIASLSGSDLTLVVTEPTPAGISDLERAIQVARHFKTKVACCVNKYDLNLERSREIEDWCRRENIPFYGHIPFTEEVIKSLHQNQPYLRLYPQGKASSALRNLWERIKKELSLDSPS